ncbi:CPBP family intramembrane metalloprotease [Nocardiopsis sp. RSe5-2]|uniref:CPBP family intramembrane metalloprotease n=1 Tax=Nocardiopsis endophytica TaxID=3018445 RepID=A0ABT4U9K7_9ACTN|nr:CPBP family intramembrane glutamic endopeptidase [Nocardiopsis endophytica]MDA2813648.1 CPBP family intramembrane metalloprotease [Nocardiopsis endophytica]
MSVGARACAPGPDGRPVGSAKAAVPIDGTVHGTTAPAAAPLGPSAGRAARTARAGRVLGWSAVLVFTACAAAYTAGSVAAGGFDPRVALLWPSIAAALALIRLLPPRVPEAGMADRIRARMADRSPGTEAALLVGCLVAFAVADAVLSPVFALIGPGAPPLSYYAAKAIFLLLIPPLFAGGTGITRRSSGPDLLPLAARVREPWRWAAPAPAAVFLALLALPWIAAPRPPGTLPADYALGAVVALTFAGVAAADVLFFSVLLQTRLELLFGRWPGIAATAVLYGLSSLVGEPLTGGAHDLASAVAVQGASGLVAGYLWARYRNLWANLLLAGGVTALAMVPPTAAFL